MANKYLCSDGEKVTQATIDRRRSETYRRIYDSQLQTCWGCGKLAQGSAHLIPQKRCKDIGKTELCWSTFNLVPSCHQCNSILESYKSEEVKKLHCYPLLLEITERYDPQRFQLMTYDNNTKI